MPRIVDDEPPIKTHPASKEYRENWEATFGEKTCAEPVETEPEFNGPWCCGCGVGLHIEKPLNTCEDCYKHGAACARLCTDGDACDCGVD